MELIVTAFSLGSGIGFVAVIGSVAATECGDGGVQVCRHHTLYIFILHRDYTDCNDQHQLHDQH